LGCCGRGVSGVRGVGRVGGGGGGRGGAGARGRIGGGAGGTAEAGGCLDGSSYRHGRVGGHGGVPRSSCGGTCVRRGGTPRCRVGAGGRRLTMCLSFARWPADLIMRAATAAWMAVGGTVEPQVCHDGVDVPRCGVLCRQARGRAVTSRRLNRRVWLSLWKRRKAHRLPRGWLPERRIRCAPCSCLLGQCGALTTQS